MVIEQGATDNSVAVLDDPLNRVTHGQASEPRIITVGGGKGGVGKTMFTVLLGLSLIKSNKRAVIVDADFRSPSMNSILQIKTPQHSLKDFFSQQIADINAVLEMTEFDNLRLVSGATGILGMTEYCFSQCSRLVSNLKKIDADYILIDLESGTSLEAIKLFLSADEQIVIANPNPMSLLENFSFLKLCQFKKFRDTFRNNSKMVSLLKATYESNSSQKFQILKDALEDYSREHPSRPIEFLRPKLVLNMMRRAEEAMEIRAFQIVCEDLLGVNLEYWGSIQHQEHMRAFVRSGNLDKLLSIDTIHQITTQLLTNRSGGTLLKRPGLKQRKINYFDSDDITCSSHCASWNNCMYQHGGYPCKLKYMGFLCTSGENT